MYCSNCGASVQENQENCTKCGRQMIIAPAPLAEQRRFKSSVIRLARFWFFFAALNVVLGGIGLFAIQTGMTSNAGPWEPWPHPYIWNWTLAGSTAWILLSARIAAAFAAGWGLARHTDWSRAATFVAAGFAFLEFPIGFALAIYAFSLLFGKHHADLYSRLGAQGFR